MSLGQDSHAEKGIDGSQCSFYPEKNWELQLLSEDIAGTWGGGGLI